MATNEERPGYHRIFRTKIKNRNGKTIYAHSYGLKAFIFWVREQK